MLTAMIILFRSKIQGLGLYAARDIDKHTMVIEYIGELIRTELAESREKQYEAKVILSFKINKNSRTGNKNVLTVII